MDMQKLFALIDRAADSSSALSQPSFRELTRWLKGCEFSEQVYYSKEVEAGLEILRDSTYTTVSQRRNIVIGVLREVLRVVCEEQGLDLVYRFPGSDNTLHVGIVVRDTHTGSDAVYGIRTCYPSEAKESVWEYLAVDDARLLSAIALRRHGIDRPSFYGYHDPSLINLPFEVNGGPDPSISY